MRHTKRQKAFGTGPDGHHRAGARRGIRPALFYATLGLLLATNAVSLTAFFMSGDIARLVNGETDRVQAAYQDRIVQLRLEVDRLHSRQYATAGNLNLQLQELAQQQEMLSEQHLYVKALADKAQELGIETASVPEMDDKLDTSLITGAITAAGNNRIPDLEKVTQSISDMMQESRQALAALSDAADKSTDSIVQTLDKVGIEPDLPDGGDTGVGGPYEPLPADYEPESLVDDANAVTAAFERFKSAREAVEQAPIHSPLAGHLRLTSPYGARRDPFTGRMAFHSGLDFGAPRGTSVRAAGAGKVSFVGVRSGYGNVVEIEHEDGLTTRYAHMSATLAHVGDEVETGDVIGKVGSTGRSTGPHLHFEVRKTSGAMNPAPFLRAGRELARYVRTDSQGS